MLPLINVLIISGDEQVHHIAQQQLGLLGHTTVSARTAAEGIGCAYSIKPDAVLLDSALGDDALLVLDAIREYTVADPGSVYIIALTTLQSIESRQRFLDAGADDILIGPVSLQKIFIRFQIAVRQLQFRTSLRREFALMKVGFNHVHSMYEQSHVGLFRVDIQSGCVSEANARASALINVPSLKDIALPRIIGDDATAEYFVQYIIENGYINDYELSIGEEETTTKRWLLLSGYYDAETHSIECVLFDITPTKNITADREDLLIRLSRQRHELQEKNSLLTQAHEEIKFQHARLFEQAMHIEESNTELEHSMTQLQHMNKELAEKKRELETTVIRLSDMQTQLVHSERMNVIGTMTAGIMHEINNPNGTCYAALQHAQQDLQNFRQTLLSMIAPQEHESDAVKKIQERIDDIVSVLHIATDSSKRISQTVDTLQNFSGFQRTEVQRANVLDVIDSATRLFHYKHLGIGVKLQTEQRIAEVSGNIGELNQVFLNILTNAAQAGATEIFLFLAKQSSTLCIDVHDNGSGIPANILSDVFSPFFSTKGSGHSGIGLSISKSIVERHGGRIYAESEIGLGTRFKILLPLADTLSYKPHPYPQNTLIPMGDKTYASYSSQNLLG